MEVKTEVMIQCTCPKCGNVHTIPLELVDLSNDEEPEEAPTD